MPSKFDDLVEWASQQGLAEEFSVTAQTFGYTKAFTIVGNLSQEFSHPESSAVLSHWQDNPIVRLLVKLHIAYQSSPEIRSSFPPLSHRGNIEQTAAMLRGLGADIGQKHFLIYLLITPLAGGCSETEYLARREFRLWLVTQALYRTLDHGCPNDAFIQRAAGFTTKSIHDKNWEIIDELLKRTRQLLPHHPAPYRHFSFAIERAAIELKQAHSKPSPTRFLNAVVEIAQGHCSPLTNNSVSVERRPHLLRSNVIGEISLTEHDDVTYRSFEISADQTETTDDDGQLALLFNVEPTDTPERKRLSGQSILLQSAEQSHFLPWSWEKALPPEVEELEAWIKRLLMSDELPEQLGATIIWLAVRLSRSLAFILNIEIRQSPIEEWSLTPDFCSVQRKPPRRHSAWFPTDVALRSWIETFADEITLAIPTSIQKILQTANIRAAHEPTHLHDLWFALINDQPETWFNARTKKRFPRLTGAKLANIQSQKAFDLTADPSLARLISAHPRSALPAACGYSNWDISSVEKGFNVPLDPGSTHTEPRLNMLGSLLAPLESLLVDHIQTANDQIANASRFVDGIEYHNLLTHYVVMALYAATGCRHLSEPFESAAFFCSSPPAVFINDKADGGLHNGRLVPLPDRALSVVITFKEHLTHLADCVDNLRSDLAQSIRQLTVGRSTKLPLFFLLDSNLRWHPVTNRKLNGSNLFTWPLPPNLFRHRYAQQLARNGLPPEIIDGWMGHAERGNASYSDASPRCWLDDFNTHREALNSCFDRLGFEIPKLPTRLPPIQLSSSAEEDYREPKRFGQSLRSQKRRRSVGQAIKAAKEDLEFFLANKSINELDAEEISEMSQLMLHRENGLPHPQAPIRFAVMTKKLEASENLQKGKIRKRLKLIESERSLIAEDCPKALMLVPELQTWTSRIKRTINKAKISKAEALTIATACLIIDKRLTYRRLVEDVVRGQNYRLIQHKKIVYIEYNEHLDQDNLFAPVQRHQISYNTASLLSHGFGIKSSIDLDRPGCPRRMHPIINLLFSEPEDRKVDVAEISVGELLAKLCRVISQANLTQLPGVVAASLSERRPPTSLCIYDYLRLREGVRYQLPNATTSLESVPWNQPHIPTFWRQNSINTEQLYLNAKSFFQEIHKILEDYKKAKAKEIAKAVDKFCKENETRVSPAVLLVGYWLADRIRAGKGRKHKRHQPYAASSAHRYLTELSGPFQGLTYNLDLCDLDEEDVTELCVQMLTLKRGDRGDLTYFGARLSEFFHWAGERGVAEPDWSELDLGISLRSVRPGIFSEAEYFQCLEQIQSRPAEHRDHALMMGFVLLIAYRFGLRAQEAIGLKRNDWCESGNLVWILVRNNPYRELKSQSGRRAVPLLFNLTDQERLLVDVIFSRYDELAGYNSRGPILCDLVDGVISITQVRKSIAPAINQVIKDVTGNPRMSLHHARHTFYNRLAPVLEGYETSTTKCLNNGVDAESVRRVLLGPFSQVSRRSTMALARTMGHSRPHTGLTSYDHLMTDWADFLTPVSSSRVHRLANATHTEDWKIITGSTSINCKSLLITRRPHNAGIIARALRLMGMGYGVERTETVMQLEPGSVAQSERLMDAINSKLRFKMLDAESHSSIWVYGYDKPRLLLRKINEGAWSRLIEQTAELPTPSELRFDGELPAIREVHHLIGRSGHLLMNKSRHCELVRMTLWLFRIPPEQYQVIAHDDDKMIASLLTEHEFLVRLSSDKGTVRQLDTFQSKMVDPDSPKAKYGGLVLQPASVGCIRNRYELVLAFLITAAVYCRQ